MIETILSNVEAQFDGVDNEPAFYFGAKYLEEHVSPPRIVWVPNVEKSSDKQLQFEVLGGERNLIFTREVEILAFIWGASFAQTEALIHCLTTALDKEHTGCGNVLETLWPKPGDIGWTANGYSAILSFNVYIPVMDKFVSIPDAPDPVVIGDAGTIVTIVEEDPGELEATLSRGSVVFDVDPTD